MHQNDLFQKNKLCQIVMKKENNIYLSFFNIKPGFDLIWKKILTPVFTD